MLKQLGQNPQVIFWLSIPLIILVGVFKEERSLVINILDIFYVIDFQFVTHLISLVFLIAGFGYWMMIKTKRQLSRRLRLAHLILTFGGLLIIWILSLFYKDTFLGNDLNNYLLLIIYIIILMIVLSQLLFLINIIRGLIIKR